MMKDAFFSTYDDEGRVCASDGSVLFMLHTSQTLEPAAVQAFL